jgi:hypothetical protein
VDVAFQPLGPARLGLFDRPQNQAVVRHLKGI